VSTRAPDERTLEALRALVERYGPELAEDPRRLGALLRDLAGDHRMEVTLLESAAAEGIPGDMLRDSGGVAASRIASLTRRLEERRGISETNARWAVEGWAFALSVGPEASDIPPPIPWSSPAPDESSEALPAAPPIPPGPVEELPSTSGGAAPEPSVDDQVPSQTSQRPISQPRPSTPPGEIRRPVRRRSSVGVLVGAAVLVVLLVAGVLAATRDDDPAAVATPAGGASVQPASPSQTDPPASPEESPPERVHAPADLRRVSVTTSQVGLKWRPPANGPRIDHYEIYRKGGGKIAERKEPAYTDGSVRAGQTYTYWIVAVGTNGTQARSKDLRVTTPRPDTPTVGPTGSPPPPSDPCSPSNVQACTTQATCEAAHGTWLGGKCVD
jgi:hypothetical protein